MTVNWFLLLVQLQLSLLLLKIMSVSLSVGLELVPLRCGKILSHTHKKGSWYIEEFLRDSQRGPHTFYMGVLSLPWGISPCCLWCETTGWFPGCSKIGLHLQASCLVVQKDDKMFLCFLFMNLWLLDKIVNLKFISQLVFDRFHFL